MAQSKKTIKVEGLKELEKNLLALQKEYGGKAAPQAMRPAIKAAIAPLKGTVEGNTPVDTGDLRDSAKVSIVKPTKKMLSESDHYNRDTIIVGRAGWFWRDKSLWQKALAVEFGTRKMAAQSVLRNTFEMNTGAMVSRFKNTLGPAIEKKAKALNKKRNKGG